MKYLEANLKGATVEMLENLEETLLKEVPEDVQYEIDSENSVVSFVIADAKKELSMADFIPQGTIVKNFLIANGIADNETYKKRFTMKETSVQEIKKPDELDKLIAKVEKDDPKLLEVASRLAKIKSKQ